MGVSNIFILLLFNYHVVKSDSNVTMCENDFINIENDEPVDLARFCEQKPCVAKCCPEGQIYYLANRTAACQTIDAIRDLTKMHNIAVDYKKIHIYKLNNDGTTVQGISGLNLIDNYRLVRNKKMDKDACAVNMITRKFRPMEGFVIGTDGSVLRDRPNFYRRWKKWEMEDACLEFMVTKDKNGELSGPFYHYRLMKKRNTKVVDNSLFEKLSAITMLVSLFFLLLVLFVYGSLRELRNLAGMILMAYVSTLGVTFLLQSIQKLMTSRPSGFCKVYSAINYTATLSSFFWMNVMSLDLWWNFRGIFYNRRINRRGELCKFMSYAAYAWGVPLLVSVVVVVIDNADLTKYPDIFKPHFDLCLAMFYDQPELMYYLYMPCLALIIMNWIFFLLTAFNIWRIRKDMDRLSSETIKYKNNQNRFGLYLKLALVMGVSWVLEVIYDLPRWLEKTAMFYNNLTGVAIFFIFVFKRKIFLKLCARFAVKGNLVENMHRKFSSSTTTGSNFDRKPSNVELNTIESLSANPTA